jgi:hypothetical protein
MVIFFLSFSFSIMCFFDFFFVVLGFKFRALCLEADTLPLEARPHSCFLVSLWGELHARNFLHFV